MKYVTCAICGVKTKNFVRHNLVPYCIDCFFKYHNICHKCHKGFTYAELSSIDTVDGLEYYCKNCLQMLYECSFCGQKIGLGDFMYFTDDNEILCRECHGWFENFYKK